MRNLSLCVVLHDEIEWEIGRDEVTAKKRVKTHIYLSDMTNFWTSLCLCEELDRIEMINGASVSA